ncbi:class I SAM-dependent methyltransferase [Sinosporangium siamense]|uniref:S-adenosyl-L-methionine-dependent methyltransferase n=1 Tax=Sinosporangium siamense TaxID=1367973 RepID=A0A919RS87_9ACTN|nr:class I SAM-dependent methyltransferase [Sinosporangium siamense]GII97601.1 S-adenosyl-L-methionine-dependent methyltransferase [Sinosporangium siamense]
MNDEQPSLTALMAAAARAAHLVVDREPLLFEDTLAHTLLGESAEQLIGYHRAHGDHLILSGVRAQVTTRSHYTERRLAASGLPQYVILGAGLDTFAHRSPLASRIAVYEVDHPATQRWKRGLLTTARLTPQGEVTFVGADFEADDLFDRLVAHGFDPARPALVSWLGVSMYLTAGAVTSTLTAVGRLAPGSELVMEYALPSSLRDERGAAFAEFAMAASAERGEPWLSFFTPAELSALLTAANLEPAEDVRQEHAVDHAHWQRRDPLLPADACRLVRAVVTA